MYRPIITLALALGFAMNAQAVQAPEIYHIMSGSDPVTIYGLSNNGAWAITQDEGEQDIDNPQPVGGALIDMSSRRLTTIPTTSGMVSLRDVTDAGVVVGNEGGVPAYWSPDTKAWTYLPINNPDLNTGELMTVTPDGRFAAGYLSVRGDFYSAIPVLYDLTTNTEIELTNIPYRGMERGEYSQTCIYDISPDGRYLLGDVATSHLMGEDYKPALWSFVYDVEQQNYTPIGFDLDRESWTFTPQHPELYYIDTHTMSTNGRYVTGAAYLVRRGGQHGGGSEAVYAYLYDLQTGEFTVCDDETEADYAGSNVTADGTMLAHAGASNPYPESYVRSGKFFVSFTQILSQAYGISINATVADGVTGRCRFLSDDGLTAIMTSEDNCYVLRMHEPFADAAKRVDLLANYSFQFNDEGVTIPFKSGIEVTNLRTFEIAFDRDMDCTGDYQSILVVDETGQKVTTALSSTSIKESNRKVLTVGLRTRAIPDGKAYTVIIPAGYLYLAADHSYKNKEIRIKFRGRGSNAVEVTRVTPAPGSNVSIFDSSQNVLTLEFDTDVMVSYSDLANIAKLYSESSDTPLASLMAAYGGREVIFYPSSTIYLYEGTDYYVEIDGSKITDMSKAGGMGTLRYDWHGAYVRSVSSDMKYLFSEDFNSNTGTWNESLIYWHTETNNPTADIAAGWGIQAGNSWMPVAQTAGSVEQAIASISMFTPAATADKWMMIPQLTIPDDQCYLAFDAQSYLKSKKDVLKVYVWATDDVINSVPSISYGKTLADRIRREADLVVDKQLSPGDSEENLSGEWEHFTIDLARYAGKKIYIAFNNNNTNQSAVFIDNVQVVRNFAFLVSLTTADAVVAAESVPVRGQLTIDDDLRTFTTATLILRDGDNREVDRIEATGLSLTKGDKYPFEFARELPLTIGEVNNYALDFTLDDVNTRIDLSVKDLAFRPERVVVLEELSGKTCSNCPQAFLAIEYLLGQYPNNFLPIAMRAFGADMLGNPNVTNYASAVTGTTAAPVGRINRGENLSPMASTGSSYTFTAAGLIDSTTGREMKCWADEVATELSTPTDGDIAIRTAYDASTRSLTVYCDVRYAMNITGKNIRLFGVIVEDGLWGLQENGYMTLRDPIFGPWGEGGALGMNNVALQMDHIARCTIGSNANGQAMTTTDFRAGEVYTDHLVSTVEYITDADRCHVIVMMIDGNTGHVINATSAPLNGSDGIADAAADINILTVGTTATITAEGRIEARAWTTDGRMIAQTSGVDTATLDLSAASGVVIISVQTPSGRLVRRAIVH